MVYKPYLVFISPLFQPPLVLCNIDINLYYKWLKYYWFHFFLMAWSLKCQTIDMLVFFSP